MPLGFQSTSHGSVAFGFFHLESDLVLLEQRLVFAPDLCAAVAGLAVGAPDHAGQVDPAWQTRSPADLGDLHGGIAGTRHVGLIGELYRTHPFPPRPEDFRQQPVGRVRRAAAEALLARFADPRPLDMVADPLNQTLTLGDIRFAREDAHALLHYLWRGGYPRWRDEQRPGYVQALAAAVAASDHWLLAGLALGG